MAYVPLKELDALGFKTVKSYEHDEWLTQRRKKGCIQLETTWLKTGKLVSQDLWIEEVSIESFTKDELIVLNKILNKLES